MPPKTLTAEQVAEIDRQQKPAVNMRDVVPQREDVLAARITAQERREAAPATLTPEQVDATEAQTSVAAMTPFGRAMGAEPDRTTGPAFQPKKRLSAAEADQMQYEQISSPAYMPTKEEFQWYEGYKKTRDDKVSKFVQGATGVAGGLVQAAAATAYAPFDLLVRGTPAWNEWVNSSAEGLRQTSIGLAELWSWGGDIYEDNQKELQRSRDLNNQIRQQLAAENKFTGNAQQDEQTLQQAIEQAKAGGLYEKTADDLNADDDTRYERFIRDRSFQQQAANITETNIGTLPDSQREMGIDPSKVNPGLAFTAQLVFDPLNAVVPGGIGALSNLRLMRRAAALTGAPLKGLSKVAKVSADKAEDFYGGILSGIESRTGLNEAAAMGALNNPVTWRAVAAMGILKGTGKVLRKSENWLETGSIIAKEAGVGGVGISRADAASRLRYAPIPERYRRAYDGFFTSADSTLRRVSETPGLSPIARRSAATLDRTGVTQAFRLADDAVSGAAAAAPIGIPFAAIAPEDRQPEILGAILSIGAAGGVVGGQARRMSEMNDALVAKMLADAEISGGDAVAMANMLSPEKLSDMARKQTMISAKADWVPLRAVDYELDKTVKAAVGNGTKGIHVEASPGKRPRVFLNLDKLASGDVAGHEIGHAIFMSDIMGGEIKQGMRAMVDVEYGAEGLAARGREYAAAMLTQEVNQGATGIKLEVLTPEEVNRKAAGVSEADLIRERWSSDSAWRDSAINDRIDLMNQERMARGGQQLDWARDEIAAETFSGLGKGVNLSGLRASGPLGRAVGAAQTALDMMGARFRGNGRLESPNRLFTENPLFDSPQMRKAVNDYVKIYDRYLVGLEKEGKVQQRGTPIAPTGRASDAARSPHTRLYPNKGVVESDLFVQRPDGTLELKSQQMVNTQDKARSATLKSINSRDRLVPENSQEWGARRLSNGRVVVGGPTLPPQFDFFLQMPEWLRFKAREFEAGRNEGRSYLYSYNAIGTGADGSYRVKNLGNVEAKTGEAVPFGWDLSQKNHLLAKVIDLNSFRASSMRAIDNQLLGEFGNDLKAVEAGLKQLLKNYQDGVPGETNLGVTKKNILNGLLGTGTPTQRANNPAWHTLNNQGSIRTFRFDRLNYADPYGTGYFPHYDKLNINALPDNAGRMSLDEYMSFDADRQTAWLNNRARERGHSNSTNWANSDEAGFAAASEEYRKLFPRTRGQAMPDSARPERADIPLNPRARQAAFISDRGEVRATGRATHFETNEDLGPDFLAIGAGHLGEDGFFRFGSQTMDDAMGESPATSSAAAARYNQSVYDQGKRPSAMLEEPPGLERPGGRGQTGQAMPDTGDTAEPRRYVSMEKFIEEAGDDLGEVLPNAYANIEFNDNDYPTHLVSFADARNSMYRSRVPSKQFFDWLHSDEVMDGLVFDKEYTPARPGEGAGHTRESYQALIDRLREISLKPSKQKATGRTRGQAMPDGSQPVRGQAMADVGSAADETPRRLIDMPQSALKVLHANSAELPKPAKKLTNATVALTLADVAEKHNNGIITSSNITPEQKSDLMILGADEAEAALKASGKNAGNWYSVAIEAALGIAGVIYRELSDAVAARSHAVLAKETDPVKAGQFALRLPLAITSQNMTVKLNTRASNEQFNIFLKTGKFDPSIAYGEKAKSISGNLDLANTMIDELGSVLALEDFVSRQFTVRELEIEASKIAGRNIKIAGRKDDIVNGAAIFGPKIGQGFLQNLMGKFDPVTIDLWMRRTWGRWTGDVVGDGVTAQRLARLIDQSRKAGRKLPDSIKRLRTTMRSMGETKTGKAKKPELTMSEDVEARLEAETAFRKDVEAFAKEVNAEFQGMYKMMSDVMSPALAKKVQDAIERSERLPDQADAILSDVYNAVIREQSRVKQQLDKRWSALPLEKKKEIAAKQLPEWANVEPKDRAQFIKKTKPVLKGDWLEMQHQAEGRTAKLDNPQKNVIKPAWANAAKSIVSELNPIDIPSDMDRRVITEVVNGIREELERRGYTVTNADVQAILWYPEKDLWAKLRGEEESILKQSYDDEFINIAEGLGLGLEARKVAKQIRGY